jgi:hypothetical protein
MDDTIRIGDRVRVAFPRTRTCTRHHLVNVPTQGVAGTVIRIRDDADHPIGVALDLWHLGTQWTDSFRPDELEPIRTPA